MTKKYYKRPTKILKKIFKIFSFCILFTGLGIIGYVFFPLLSWQIYFAPVFASQAIDAPIPKTTVLTGNNISSLLNLSQTLNVDYTNAQNWFPEYHFNKDAKSQIYKLSIPKLKITEAIVSANDNDLTKHLVNYGGTAIPPSKGTSVVFGHSTLPQLFNEKDYKTIFATLYLLQNGDEIIISVDGKKYVYNVYEITIVNATDNSVFDQNYNESFLTLVTCTPPGTVWKRLVIRARLNAI
jgi:sortase A